MKRRLISTAIGLLIGSAAWSAEPFVVSDIRIEGLQRISSGSVFAAMPINVGDRIGDEALQNAIRSLFRTGNFDDVRLAREGGVLVVAVQERPSISEISIEGNKAIKTEALLEGLSKAGLAQGQVFKRATLEGMRQELLRQYVSQGRYDANVQTDVVAEPRNRVKLQVNIDEGSTAKIRHIAVVGNSVFDDETLIDLFELRTTGLLSWLTGNDKYAREKLQGDLERLSSYYLDRGYIKFRIDSTQVSVTPDRESVYITVNVDEGLEYQVGEVDLSGEIILPEEELRKLILLREGDTFSQALVTNTEELLTKRLGNEGYNFAKVRGLPEIDDQNRTVAIRFFVDPGKRTYVRRIDFRGNSKSADEVMRREMRQMEAAPASADRIEQSRVRLERLGYFKEATVDTLAVPGTDDLIDLQYTVEEQPSGSIGASVGYAQDAGLLLGANLQQDNFLGTGKQVGIGLSKSEYLTDVRFSFNDPYFTEDGVSRGFSVFYREANLDEINVADYTLSTKGANVSFGYPIKETSRLSFTFGVSNTQVDAGYGTVKEIIGSPRPLNNVDWVYDTRAGVNGGYAGPEVLRPFDPIGEPGLLRETTLGFLDEYGDSFDEFSFTIAWSQSTLNRGQLATRGYSQSVAFELALPGSDLEFYKLTYNGQIFVPLSNNFTLRFRTELGYGEGFGDIEGLPFFRNFYSGGFASVRGFKSNTLGPRGTPADIYRIGRACVAVDANGSCTQFSNEAAYVVDPETGEILVDTLQSQRDADPFGGNILVEGSVELLFPLPFVKDQRSLRSALFLDVGNVFSTTCGTTQVNCTDVDFAELRYSVGFGVTWITGFGPLTFSLAKPLNEGDYDESEVFQFSLGRGF
jgi:outer membrane protein insertion porin family